MSDSTQYTLEHIGKVQARLQECISNLTVRATHHDESKLQEPEKSAFDRMVAQRATTQEAYDSPEYRQRNALLGAALQHHYEVNDHHPDGRGIAGMSLLALIEHLCDLKAVTDRYPNGDINQLLLENRERFGISDQLASILENTVREMGW